MKPLVPSMKLKLSNPAAAGVEHAARMMRDEYRQRFIDELNEAIIQVMFKYHADDEVKWFSMVESPLLKLEE